MTRLARARALLFEHRHFGLAYVVLAPLYLAPLFATRFLPAFDLPHHVAVADALSKTHLPDSPYARDFRVGFELAPFLMHFILLRALGLLVSLNIAAMVLVGAVVVTLPLASARLLAVTGRSTLPALLAFPLVYSMPLHYGLMAFVLALPFFVWMLAEASDQASWRDRPRRSALLLGTLSFVTFFVHLEAWAVGVVAAALAVLLATASWSNRALGLASLVPSLVCCLLYLDRGGSDPLAGPASTFAGTVIAARLQELAGHGVLADVWGRVRVAPIHLLRGFRDGSDVVAARVLLGVLTGFALGWCVKSSSHVLRGGRVTPAAGLVAVAALAYFGLPHHAPPDAYSIYPRFAVVLALLLVLAVPARLSRWPDRARQAVAGVLALALSVYAMVVVRHYAAFGRELVDLEQVFEASPPGLASGGLVFDAESIVMNVDGIFTGLPAYYVTERAAPGSSTWLYYCVWPQFPCRIRDPDRPPPLPFFSNPADFVPARALDNLQLLFVRGGPPAAEIFGAELPRVRLLAEQGRWRAFVRR